MAIDLEDEDNLQVSPLAAAELAWAKQLDALLSKMPERLKLFEVDGRLMLVDREQAEQAGDGGFGDIREAGAVLADLSGGLLKVSGMTH